MAYDTIHVMAQRPDGFIDYGLVTDDPVYKDVMILICIGTANLPYINRILNDKSLSLHERAERFSVYLNGRRKTGGLKSFKQRLRDAEFSKPWYLYIKRMSLEDLKKEGYVFTEVFSTEHGNLIKPDKETETHR